MTQRGVYAQGWFARGYNYHPSLPPRRLKMVEDFAAYRATMITWPSLGGGPISLAYLEDEAYAPVPARYRQYGFLKDSEFLTECRRRGVKAFSVIFSTQGWEFPAELNDAEDEILAMNELRGVGKRTWLGLREFTQNTYPKLWAPFEKYFPDGLTNSRGQRVTDLFEECASRDIHGRPHHADWLEVPAREHVCHYMDINNPVWREYLKAIVRIHIDAGVDGIQFDEPDSPLSALRYGGCFCHDCMTGFAGYLDAQDPTVLPADVRAALPGFHYGDWLLQQGRSGFDPADEDPLARFFARFLQQQVARNFAELTAYVRAYAAEVGRTVLVSANLYDGAPWNDPLAALVDVLVPEQRHTLFRQPGWMRFIAGLAGGRDACISLNPYGGVIPDLVPALRQGRSLDRYRVMLYEAAAMGVNMSVPYGAWMGARIEDAMWAPHEETVEIQDFLADHEHLFGPDTDNRLAVVYSVQSNFLPQVAAGALQARLDPVTGRRAQSTESVPFFTTVERLAQDSRPLDVLVFHDGTLRTDDASADALLRYERVILPGCSSLTVLQSTAVLEYLDQGGHVTVVGDLGPREYPGVGKVLDHPRTTLVPVEDPAADDVAPDSSQVELAGRPAVAVNVVRSPSGPRVHLVNYEYDEEQDCTKRLPNLSLTLGLDTGASTTATLHQPGHPAASLPVSVHHGRAELTIPELGPFAVVELATEPRP